MSDEKSMIEKQAKRLAENGADFVTTESDGQEITDPARVVGRLICWISLQLVQFAAETVARLVAIETRLEALEEMGVIEVELDPDEDEDLS